MWWWWGYKPIAVSWWVPPKPKQDGGRGLGKINVKSLLPTTTMRWPQPKKLTRWTNHYSSNHMGIGIYVKSACDSSVHTSKIMGFTLFQNISRHFYYLRSLGQFLCPCYENSRVTKSSWGEEIRLFSSSQRARNCKKFLFPRLFQQQESTLVCVCVCRYRASG